MRREAPAVLSMVLLAAVAGAQEDVREQEPTVEEQEMEEMSAEDRRPLVVLENPYELSSFYRSAEGSYMGPGYPMYPGSGSFGYPGQPSADRYPIASYYRQRDGWYGYGYAPFWTGGYGAYGSGAYGGRGHRGRGGLGLGFRRSIGENGDLFLFAPAFLAPVGPLTGVFFGGGAVK